MPSANYFTGSDARTAVGVGITPWSIYYQNGNLKGVELALGPSGSYLKTTGFSSAPIWSVPSGAGDVVGPGSHSADYVPQWSTPNSKVLVEGFAITAAGKAILDDADAAAQIATLGLDADLGTFSLPANTTISANGGALVAANYAAMMDLLSGEATAGFSFNNQYVTHVQQLRGCPIHHLNIYANATTGDADEKDIIFWTLDATGDAWVEVFRCEANSTAPTLKMAKVLDMNSQNITSAGTIGCGTVTVTVNNDVLLSGSGHVTSGSEGFIVGTLTITDGSIDDTDGSISLGATNLTSVGTIGCGTITTTGNVVLPDDGTVGCAGGPILTFDDTLDYLTLTANDKLVILGGSDVTLDANTGDFIIGAIAGQHLAFDANEIQSKTDGTTAGTLYLNNEGGDVSLGANILVSDRVDISGGTAHPLIAANKWGFATDFTETGIRLVALDTGDESRPPAVWIERDYISNGTPTGDPTVPVGLYVAHEHAGSGVGFTHSIMAYALNNGTGDNDVVAVSGRARKLGAGVGDAAGVWGSAYVDVDQNGGVMALEGSIYQNIAGLGSGQDNMGAKWSVACHLMSSSTTENALAALAIDAVGNYGFWNGILFDNEMWRDAVGGTAGLAGTVAINMGDFSSGDGKYPQYAIKFGYAGADADETKAHIFCNSNLKIVSQYEQFYFIDTDGDGGDTFKWYAGTTPTLLMTLSGGAGLDGVLYVNAPTGKDVQVNCQINGVTKGGYGQSASNTTFGYTGFISFYNLASDEKARLDTNGNLQIDGKLTESGCEIIAEDALSVIADMLSIGDGTYNEFGYERLDQARLSKKYPWLFGEKIKIDSVTQEESTKYYTKVSTRSDLLYKAVMQLNERVELLEAA